MAKQQSGTDNVENPVSFTPLTEAELDKAAGGTNTGSHPTGGGAGKVTFNEFSITRKIDKSSPIF